ncbi:MAG: hypothetical protein HQ539_01285 [Parcubacteria group bacterium]|nr:hypothetical protein [Parcubacteria group bacterium]
MAMAESSSGGSSGGGAVKASKAKAAKVSNVDKNTEIKVHSFYASSYFGCNVVNATLVIPGEEGDEYSIATTPAIGTVGNYNEYLGGHVINVYLHTHDYAPNVALRIRAISKNGKVSNKAPLLINPQSQNGGGVIQKPDGDINIWGPWIPVPIFPVIPVPPGGVG